MQVSPHYEVDIDYSKISQTMCTYNKQLQHIRLDARELCFEKRSQFRQSGLMDLSGLSHLKSVAVSPQGLWGPELEHFGPPLLPGSVKTLTLLPIHPASVVPIAFDPNVFDRCYNYIGQASSELETVHLDYPFPAVASALLTEPPGWIKEAIVDDVQLETPNPILGEHERNTVQGVHRIYNKMGGDQRYIPSTETVLLKREEGHRSCGFYLSQLAFSDSEASRGLW